jgi:hypothetical protein
VEGEELHRRRSDVSADGQRFLVNTSDQIAESTSVALVINWQAGLKK